MEQGQNIGLAPIRLARESPFCLGEVSVYPATRQVVRNGRSETLEPRIMQVLVALAQANGAILCRDDLIIRCWDGRAVGDNAIQRAVSKIRDLGRDLGGAFHLETIAKVGYRLSSPPAAQSQPPLSHDKTGEEAARQWRRVVESCRPLIATQTLEGEPAFSPNGTLLAYVSGNDTLSRKIYVRNVARGDGIRITGDAYDNVSPSWAADSSRIAYIARKKGEPCRIMVTTIPAGEAREVGRCAHAQTSTVSWQPGTSFLYYCDRTGLLGDSIFRLDLDSGARLQLVKKGSDQTPAGRFQAITQLQCSPDAKSLLYLWRQTASTNAIVIRDLTSGEEHTLGKIITGGSAAWSEDSRAVLAATASGIGSEITVHPLDSGLPYRLYATATSVSHLAAGAGGLLALESGAWRENLARAVVEQHARPELIDAANGRSWSPTFAPDGTLAFLSNRSSTNAVWIMKPGGAPALLYDAGLAPLFRLEYSPDGKWLAAAVAQENGITIRILTADGAVLTAFDSPTLGYGHPVWTPDSKAVILFDRSVSSVIRVALDDPAQRIPIAPAPPWCAIAMRGSGTFATRIDMPGLWQIGGKPRLVSDKYPIHYDPPIAFRDDDLLIPDFGAPDGPRILAQPLAGGMDRVIGYAPGAHHSPDGQSKIAVNPKTREMIYVASVAHGTTIELLTLARE